MRLFSRRDALNYLGLTPEDFLSHWIAIGGTGSGKTSLLAIILVCLLMRSRQIGMTFACVKPDEADNARRIINRAGAQSRLIHLRPGFDTYNFLSYELNDKPGGSPVTATRLLEDLNLIVSKSSSNTTERFWANLFSKMCEYAITIAWLASRREVTIELVYMLIVKSPLTIAEVANPDFKEKNQFFKVLKLAESNVQNDHEARLLKQASNFFLSEAPGLGSKARAAAVAECSAVLSPFLQSPLYETVNATHSSFTPDMAIQGACVILDAPIMVHGIGGILFQNLVITQITEAALRAINPRFLTYIIRDELQMLVADARKEAMNLSISRSQKLGFISAVQSIPTLQSAMGGNQAEHELHSLLGNYSIKTILSTPCARTAQYFSEAWGQHLEQFVSVSENRSEDPPDLLQYLLGDDRMTFSVSASYAPRCPIDAFLSLRRGGHANRRLVDFFYTVAGRTFGRERSPYTIKTLRQLS